MLEDTDFKNLEWLLILSLICTATLPQAILELIYIPWDILINTKGISYGSRAKNHVLQIILSSLSLVSLFYKSSLNCKKRIMKCNICAKQGWREYFIFVFIYFTLLFAVSSMMLVLIPPMLHLREQLVPNDARPR